jgi:PAS domain S-box-containing protein
MQSPISQEGLSKAASDALGALHGVSSLRRCIRDLVALSTLPAMWQRYDPRQIADSLAAVLLSMLDVDFVYVALPGENDQALTEVTQLGKEAKHGSLAAIQAAARHAWNRRSEQIAVFANLIGEADARVVTIPIGVAGDAVLISGSRQLDFPTEAQWLVLGIGANDATIALQRSHAEAEERRFVSLVERSSDFISMAGLDGTTQYVNPAGMKLVGLSAADDKTRLHIFDFLTPGDRIRAREECWPIVMRTGRWNGEVGFRHFETGAAMPFHVDLFRIDHPRTGRPMNVATVSRDLTGQKRYETELRQLNETLEHRVFERAAELAKANERLVTEMAERVRADARLQELQQELCHAARLSTAGQMAAALAHELNQPLTAFTNSVHAARRLLARDEHQKIATVQEVLSEAAEQAVRSGEIIRRLRDFVTCGETQRRIESLPTLIKDGSALAMSGSGTLDTRANFHFDPMATKVFVDRVQIQQVVINLIRNALDAMAGMKRREFAVTTLVVKPDLIEIAVADRGPGLPHETARHLFEPFVSTKRGGMGLGLVISRSIVRAHGGDLWSEPNPGGGAIFRFSLARGLSDEDVHAW